MTVKRILVGARCFADAEPAIPLAIDLAMQTGSALHGVFAEDETMLDLSHRMTLVAVGGTRLTASRDAMKRACLVDAKVFRRTLAEAARVAGVDCTFDTGLGSLESLFDSSARRGDLLLYGYRPPFAARNCIIVIADGAKGTEGLIDLSVKLAERTRKPLHAILLGGAHPSIMSAAKVASLVNVASLKDACGVLERRSPMVVVTALDPEAKVDLSEILDAARAPLIVAAPQNPRRLDESAYG